MPKRFHFSERWPNGSDIESSEFIAFKRRLSGSTNSKNQNFVCVDCEKSSIDIPATSLEKELSNSPFAAVIFWSKTKTLR